MLLLTFTSIHSVIRLYFLELSKSEERRPFVVMTSASSQQEQQHRAQLLTALAQGVRNVQGLPVEDDFEFHSALPTFDIQRVQQEWMELVQEILPLGPQEHHDSIASLWDACTDTTDDWMEQVEAFILTHNQKMTMQASARRDGDDEPLTTHHFPLPQKGNQRTEPFVPPSLSNDDDLPFRDPNRSLWVWMDEEVKNHDSTVVVGPSQYIQHPYQIEIESLEYTSEQLKVPLQTLTSSIPVAASLEFSWIDTLEGLQALAGELNQVSEFAMDLEAHSLHTFAGFTCLMQISTRSSHYIVDVLQLEHLHPLASPLANPSIVKVMHGANHDVQWLQRDFGLYVVNLFDTGQASRALQFPSASLAYLLRRFVPQIKVDKSFQLADWRVRPLSDAMKEYAMQDTYYLLDVYDQLRTLLKADGIRGVLDKSKEISLIRFKGVPFKPKDYETKVLHPQRVYTDAQIQVAETLWDWRDGLARKLDESPRVICSLLELRRLVHHCPTSLSELQEHVNNSFVLQNSTDILNLIKASVQMEQPKAPTDAAVDDDEEELKETMAVATPGQAPSSAFFKPAEGGGLRRELLSPVLGTEDLYNLVGWTSPSHELNDESSSDPAPKALAVNSSNKNFQSNEYSEHSIEMSTTGEIRSKSVDGSATSRAAMESDKKLPKASNRLRDQKYAIPVVLGLVSPSPEEDMTQTVDEGETIVSPKGADEDDVQFEIPRSMREIYKISNRNRRVKKASSPTSLPMSDKEREELTEAENKLRERGLLTGPGGYFDDAGNPSGKRARTKSGTGRESEESVPAADLSTAASKEDDMAFLKKIGYVDKDESIESMLQNQNYIYPAEVDYPVGMMGALSTTPSSNPFFSGAAIVGGPLAQAPKEKKKGNTPVAGKPKAATRRQMERPEKKDGKMHAYRKR